MGRAHLRSLPMGRAHLAPTNRLNRPAPRDSVYHHELFIGPWLWDLIPHPCVGHSPIYNALPRLRAALAVPGASPALRGSHGPRVVRLQPVGAALAAAAAGAAGAGRPAPGAGPGIRRAPPPARDPPEPPPAAPGLPRPRRAQRALRRGPAPRPEHLQGRGHGQCGAGDGQRGAGVVTGAGLWVLSPRRQHTSALRIAAARGYEDCARHLLLRGAAVDAVVGGRAPLHDSAAAPHPNCARLLLAFGADPNVLSADGSAPLHLCTAPHSLRCAELLLAHGAQVNLGTRDRQVTALHVAARQGLVAHVELYLHHGADPSVRTHQGETPLNAAAAAAERPEDSERFLRVAERLLEAGAEPGAAGRKGHTPLHNACANGHPAMARLLLRHGADAAVPNGAGDTPMDCALRAVREYRQQRPEETLTLLLDHGALPGHPKMLRLCCQHPPALEVMLNAYDRVPPADGWVEAVPPELWEEHQEFYASAVRMAGQPRRLQHLARVAIRRHLGARCRAAVPRLALPPALRRYLQLPIEGLIS